MATEPLGVQSADDNPMEVETDERTARADWHSSVYGAVVVTLLIGVWLIVSAGLLDYAKPELPIIWGIAIALLGLATAILALVGLAAETEGRRDSRP